MTTIDEPESTTAQPDELFVRFANTFELSRGEAVDHLPDPESLLTWLRDEGLISNRARAAESGRIRRDPEEGERRLLRFRRLRDVLHAVAGELGETRRVSPAHLGELNHILRHGLHYHQLRHEPGGTRYAVAQVGDRLDQARAAIAGSFAHFLAAGAADRLRTCANEGCRYVFIDHSPAGRRRWCDMRTCGNQAKVARHRARIRPATESRSALPQKVASV
ncbi:MAG TPA: CGNR zinc finger domain-containing protein [Candidatus Limnocylindrales bacterium]|nr:CGNR zinc finger domain-containing protein [Candidatus Limnocylindrales bacterium]